MEVSNQQYGCTGVKRTQKKQRPPVKSRFQEGAIKWGTRNVQTAAGEITEKNESEVDENAMRRGVHTN